jgi:hypothetical protein
MEVTLRKLLVAAALVGLIVSPATAGHPLALGQSWGRWIGYGWGEGYHARDAMPARRPHSKHAQRVHWPVVMQNAPIVPPPPLKNVEILPLPLPPRDAPTELQGPG